MRLTKTPAIALYLITALLAVTSVSGQNPVPVGEQIRVDDYLLTSGGKNPRMTLSTDGDFIIVWDSSASPNDDTDGRSIQGKKYTSAGAAVFSQFQVNTYTTNSDEYPDVAPLPDGGFVVVWEARDSPGNDDSSDSVQVRRFDRDGNGLAAQLQVNSYTTSIQENARVASAADGSFVVVWDSFTDSVDSSSSSVHGQRFDSAGLPVSGQFRINTYTTNDQSEPAVASLADGSFMVVWKSAGSTGTDTGSSDSIQGQRYDSDGTTVGANFQINTYTTGRQDRPEIALAPDGRFAVVWRSVGSAGTDTDSASIQGRRYDSDGTAVGDDFQINTTTTSSQEGPDLAMAGDGSFTVVWYSHSHEIHAQRFDSAGAPSGTEFEVSTPDAYTDSDPAIVMDAAGDFLVTWDGTDELLGRRYRVTGDIGGRIWRDEDADGVQDGSEADFPGVLVELYDDLNSLVDQTTSGADGRYFFRAEAGDYTVRVSSPAGFSFSPQDQGGDKSDSDVDSVGESALFIMIVAMASPDLDAGLIPPQVGDRVWRDLNENGIQDGGEPGVPNVTVTLFTEAGSETAQTTTDDDGLYSLTADPASYYLEFTLPAGEAFSPRDAGGDDTLDSDAGSDGRTIVFNLDGTDTTWDAGLLPLPPAAPAGDDFQVNAYTTSLQNVPSMAMDDDGDFVVVYRSRDYGASLGIRGQRFASDGSLAGDEFIVNTYTQGSQHFPDVSMAGSGEFVVVWRSYGSFDSDSDALSIQGQRFASDGSQIGGQFQVNTYTTGSDYQPKVAMDDTGAFIVAWTSYQSNNGDADGLSVQARRFNSDGSAIGDNFLVNEVTGGDQTSVSIAAHESHGFVVAWTSFEYIAFNGPKSGGLQDNDPPSIRARRFGTDGSAIGSQFLVNSYVTGGQQDPSVALLDSGEFIIAFDSNGSDQGDTDGESVMLRRFASDGSALASELQVNTYTTSFQTYPRVAAAPSGEFVVVWSSAGSADGLDTDGDSIQGQRFSVTGQRIGSEFTVNTWTTGNQLDPAVAMDPWGDFAISWTQSDPTPTDSSTTSVRSRRFRVTGDLGDKVFEDSNADGLQGAEEPGIIGVGVDLYNADEALIASAVTDSDGRYFFGKVGQGDYTLRIPLLPSAYTGFTSQDVGVDDTADSDFDAMGRTAAITVDAAETDLNQDAGLLPSRIGDRIWLDDGNGIQDSGEAGIAGVTVILFSDLGMELDSTITDGEGLYELYPGPGDYYLEVVPPADLALAPQDQGADDSADSDFDPDSATTSVFALAPGVVDATRDAGLEPAVIGNRVWLDTSRDGIQQPGEPGYAGVTVRLLDAADQEVASDITDADGIYGFLGIASGDYRIEVIPPAETVFSAQDAGGDDLIDSDVDPATGRTAVFTYGSSTASSSHDAGVFFPPLFADGFESGDVSGWSSSTP